MNITHRVLVYLFPGLLIAFEWLLLAGSNTNVAPAIGPSLAAGALGLLVPLTTPKVKNSLLSEDDLKKLQDVGLAAVNRKDSAFSSFCLMMLLFCLVLWACTATISITGKIPGFLSQGLRWDLIVGGSSYVFAAVLAEIKEVL